MVFRFRCAACNDVLSAAADLAGTALTCPGCGTVLEIPSPPPRGRREGAGADEGLATADEAPLDFSARRRAPEEEMDMTPMVDVTFLLLIFFMVTAAFSLQKSFPIPTPNPSQPTAPTRTLRDYENDPEWVVVRIDSNGTFHVLASSFQEETPSKHELMVQLRKARQGGLDAPPPTRMLLVAHGEAAHVQVVTAIDSGTAVGMEEIKLMTVEEDF